MYPVLFIQLKFL